MKLCFYDFNLGNSQINSIFGGMYNSFWEALETFNVEVNYTKSIDTISGDILIVTLGGGQEIRAAKAMAKFNGPIIINVPPANLWFYSSFLKRWKDKILFAYGTDSSLLSFEKYRSLNISYYHFPFASDSSIFYPMNLPKIYDVVFVGNATSGEGRYRYISLLSERAKERGWNILLIGTGWEKYGFPFQIVAHGKLLNTIYNLGKICINLHNDSQYLGGKIQMDANNRVFDLAMSGCFQIGNATELVAKYFNNEEVVGADDSEGFVKKIEYYLDNEEERKQYETRAQHKALLSHSWNNRAEYFIECIRKNNSFISVRNEKNVIKFLLKTYDQTFLPPYKIKLKLNILKLKLKRWGGMNSNK